MIAYNSFGATLVSPTTPVKLTSGSAATAALPTGVASSKSDVIPEKSNTMMYVGVGVAALAAWYFFIRK